MKNTSSPKPKTIKEAWLNLATDILLLAIEDVRQTRNPEKRKRAKAWLLSPAGEFLFDMVLDTQFDIHKWIFSNCPKLENE